MLNLVIILYTPIKTSLISEINRLYLSPWENLHVIVNFYKWNICPSSTILFLFYVANFGVEDIWFKVVGTM